MATGTAGPMTLRRTRSWGCSHRPFRLVDAEAVSGHPQLRLFALLPWPHDPANGWPHGPANRHLAACARPDRYGAVLARVQARRFAPTAQERGACGGLDTDLLAAPHSSRGRGRRALRRGPTAPGRAAKGETSLASAVRLCSFALGPIEAEELQDHHVDAGTLIGAARAHEAM